MEEVSDSRQGLCGAARRERGWNFEEIMSQRFKLTCPCGIEHPVELSQAGRSVECACGRRLAIPSMLKMKRLPPWGQEDVAGRPAAVPEPGAEPPETVQVPAAEGTVPAAPQPPAEGASLSGAEPKKRVKFPAARKGLLIAGILGFLFFSALLVRTVFNPPELIDVLNIQRFYLDKGKVIQRDSNPIEGSDAYFFITKDGYIVNDSVIDRMTPVYSVEYFDYLKTGLNLSDNFYDKYDSLIVRHRLMMIFFGVLAGISLAAAAVPLFLPNVQKTVGAARGSDWKS